MMSQNYESFTLSYKDRKNLLKKSEWTVLEASCYLCDLKCYYNDEPPHDDRRYLEVQQAFVKYFKKRKNVKVALGPNVSESYHSKGTYIKWAQKYWSKTFTDAENYPYPNIVSLYERQEQAKQQATPEDKVRKQIDFLEKRNVPVKLFIELLFESYQLAWGNEIIENKCNIEGKKKFKSEILKLFKKGQRYSSIPKTDITDIVFRLINPNNKGGVPKGYRKNK